MNCLKDSIDFITGDVFEKYRDQYTTCDCLLIHSRTHVQEECRSHSSNANPGEVCISPFCFPPNAMFDIFTHTNCVHYTRVQDLLSQNAEVLIEDEVPDPKRHKIGLIDYHRIQG